MLAEEVVTAHNHASKYGGVNYYEDAPTIFQCEFEGWIDEDSQLPLCSVQFAVFSYVFTPSSSIDYDSYAPIDVDDEFIFPIVNSSNDSSGIDRNFMCGGLLDRCRMSIQSNIFILSNEVFTSQIASQPYQLCFCSDDQDYECTGTWWSIETNRGQMFEIPILALDQMKSSTSTHVTAKTSDSARLKSKQNYQELPSNCSRLIYNLYSTGDSEELVLYLMVLVMTMDWLGLS